jgi:hypothetical protein
VPEVAEEVGVPKVLEGVVVEKVAFASTAPTAPPAIARMHELATMRFLHT